MSFVTVALIGAGATVGAAALSRKSGGGGVGFQEVPESEEAKEARRRLLEISEGPLPEIPLQKIAPLPDISEERVLARDLAKEFAQPTDFLSLPEVQAIIAEARITGDLLTNRLGRGLQKVGAASGTPGRDVLGRAVTDIEQSLTATLAPFAQEERSRRERQIGTLETLGLTEEERQRIFEQAGLSAEFAKEFAESEQLQTFTIPLLQSIIGLQPGIQPVIPQQQTPFLSQIAPILGPALQGILSRGRGTPNLNPTVLPAGANTTGFLA